MAINPNLQTNLKSTLAQGYDVGGIAADDKGVKYRWSGDSWQREPAHMQDPSVRASDPDWVREQYMNSIKPAVSSLEQSIPEISSKYSQERTRYQGEIAPLQERYKNLIDQINGKYKVAEERQTVTTNNELGRRGLSNDSGLYQQTMTNALNPITSEAAGRVKEVGLSQEDDIRAINNAIAALTPKETEETRSVRNAIAQLQAGAGANGLQAALAQIASQAELDERKRQFDSQLSYNKQKDSAASLNPNSLISVGNNSNLYNPSTGQWITPPQTASGLNTQFNANYTPTTSSSTYKLIPSNQYKSGWAKPPPGFGYNANGQLLPL